ncbi:MAG: hypothetical protein HY646_11315 [Acidobacteria bacterium]|nr:hypothetical protein [Acidobacteriota bacterium]
MKAVEHGFSLLEALMVVAIVIVTSSIALVQVRQSMAVIDADRAADMVSSQIRYARQIAVDQRRNVTIAFIAPNQIQITRQDDGEDVTVSEVSLPAGFVFNLPGETGDTPENYGNDAAIYFNAQTSGAFLGDGTFVDPDGVILNGTVFTIGSNPGSARAVTLTGASGRTRKYQLVAGEWVAR